MEAKYFNKWEFDQAHNSIKTNPLKAKFAFEEYIRKYPKDYHAYPYYIYTLIIIGESEKAKEILEYAETIGITDSHFFNESQKFTAFKKAMITSRLRVLASQEKYEELYQFYLENVSKEEADSLYTVILFCKKKMGTLVAERDVNSYILRQIIEYQESDFLEHIEKHMYGRTKETDRVTAIFSPEFPISEVIEEMKKHIPSDKKLCTGFFTDKYVFKYDRCGRSDHKIQDFFKVACFHNTSEFITMFPASDCEELPFIDLNYLQQTPETPKVKTMSQIDKFNQRYRKSKQTQKE